MEIELVRLLTLAESSGVGDARRIAAALAGEIGFSATDAGRAAIVVTEIATNLVKHARDASLLLHHLRNGSATGMRALAVDRGPGMTRVHDSMRDGFSTSGTAGNGLGAIARQASHFDVFSDARGTVLVADVWPGARSSSRNGWSLGAVSVPVAGEQVCGDGWCCLEDPGRSRVLVSDGLGHGPLAAVASNEAVAIFRKFGAQSPAEIVEGIHAALRATRGAAVAVAEIDSARGLLRYCGIGNISARVLIDGKSRSLVSHHGTAGHDARKVQEFQYPWERGATLVLHSDGIDTRWNLDDYPGLLLRDPTIVAGVLYRDHARARDDATAVVLRAAP